MAVQQVDPTGDGAVAGGGAWCWFGDPRASHVTSDHARTYIGYITNDGGSPRVGDIVVAQYDHDSREVSHAVVASGITCDDHNTPSVFVQRDGRLLVLWSGHHDPAFPMVYRRSTTPEDIREWTEPTRLAVNTGSGARADRYTYPNPVWLSAEPDTLYLFWRGGNFHPNVSTSTDGATDGDTWSPAQTLVHYQDGERPYLKVCGNGTDTIHFAFTEGHPRSVPTSIRYMYYRAGYLFRADGSVIRPFDAYAQEPVRPDEASLVYDADEHGAKAWVHDIATDADGYPVIVYANFPTDADHRYRYARWMGEGWLDQEIVAAGGSISPPGTNEPYYSGGISLDHADPSVVLLSRQPTPDTRHRVERWRTPDAGRTWTEPEVLAQDLGQMNVRPIKPRGLAGEGALSALWMAGEYPAYTNFGTRIMTVNPDGAAFCLSAEAGTLGR